MHIRNFLLRVVAINFITSELIDSIHYYFYDENSQKEIDVHACYTVEMDIYKYK